MDKRYCLIDHVTGTFVVSESLDSLVLNSYYAPAINKTLKECFIGYAEWRQVVETGAMNADLHNEATINETVGFTVTCHG